MFQKILLISLLVWMLFFLFFIVYLFRQANVDYIKISLKLLFIVFTMFLLPYDISSVFQTVFNLFFFILLFQWFYNVVYTDTSFDLWDHFLHN